MSTAEEEASRKLGEELKKEGAMEKIGELISEVIREEMTKPRCFFHMFPLGVPEKDRKCVRCGTPADEDVVKNRVEEVLEKNRTGV